MTFSFLCCTVVVAVIAGFVYQITRWVTVCRSMQSQCRKEWSNLQSLLSGRHLIVSHLLDALPKKTRTAFLATELAEALSEVQLAVAGIEDANPSVQSIYRVGNAESEMLELLRKLILELGDTSSQAQAHEATAGDRSIAACLAAIEAGESEINDAKSTFNGTAITHQAHRCTKVAKTAKWLGCKQPDYCVVNIQWYGANGDSSHGGSLRADSTP